MINATVFNHTLRNVLVIPLIGLVLLLTLLFMQVGNLLEAGRWTDHTHQVIAQDQKTRNTVLHMQSELRGYFLTDEPGMREHFDRDKAEFMQELSRLRALVADNPEQVSRARDIDGAYTAWLSIIQEEVGRYSQNKDYPALVAQEQAAHARLDNLFIQFREAEENLLVKRNAAVQKTAKTTQEVVVGAALLLAMIMGSLIRKQMISLARSYGGALASLQTQADTLQAQTETLQAQTETLQRNADEIQALNARLEQRVQERTAQLEASNKELEAFSYSVSHDLRAPLRSIDGFSQALLEDYGDVVDAEGKKYLARLRDNSRKMAGLIDDLLGLSRLTRAELKIAPVNLSETARGVAEEIRSRDPERTTAFEIADNVMVEGDDRLLRIALENLFGNAWKFTGKKSDGRIQFGTEAQDGETVYFVRDNGAGFDMAYADKLFGAFQRLHGVAEFEGTGIGLAIVQRIIRRHGGRIWAEGIVGQGAIFYFTLGEA